MTVAAARYDAEKAAKEEKEWKDRQLKRIEEAKAKAKEPKGELVKFYSWVKTPLSCIVCGKSTGMHHKPLVHATVSPTLHVWLWSVV